MLQNVGQENSRVQRLRSRARHGDGDEEGEEGESRAASSSSSSTTAPASPRGSEAALTDLPDLERTRLPDGRIVVHPEVQHVFCAATMSDTSQRRVGEWLKDHFRYATHVATKGLHRPGARVTFHTIRVEVDALRARVSAEDDVEALAALVEQTRLEAVLKALQTHPPTATLSGGDPMLAAAMLTSSKTNPNASEDGAETSATPESPEALAAAAARSKTLIFTNSYMACEAVAAFLDERGA